METILTTSELRSFRQCRLQWDLSYNQRLTPKRTSQKFFLGSAIHHALEHFYGKSEDALKTFEAYCLEHSDEAFRAEEEYQETVTLGKDMLTRYLKWAKENKESFNDTELKVINTELEFRVPIPAFVRNTKNGIFAGKIDQLIERNGELWIGEIKTAKTVNDQYLQNLQYDPQVTGYVWAVQKFLNKPVVGVIYTVLRKIVEGPRTKPPYFVRVPVYRNFDELKRFEQELYSQLLEMRRHKIYRNFTESCFWKCPMYNSLCLEDTPESRLNFDIKEKRHSELTEVEEG